MTDIEKNYDFLYVKNSIEKIDNAFRTRQYKRAMLLYVFLLETLTVEDRTMLFVIIMIIFLIRW